MVSLVRRLRPYALGLVGVAAITIAIGLTRRWAELPTLPVAYVLLVMYVGARSGRPAALTIAAVAFLVYEFFFVPPYGTPWISAPHDVVSLVVLLLAAAVGERLVAALVARTGRAEASARESAALYGAATAALRDPEVESALDALCRLAATDGGLQSMTVVVVEDEAARVIAGPDVRPPELDQARSAFASGRALGGRLEAGRLELFEQFPAAAAHLPLASGVAVLRRHQGRPPDVRFVSALLGLAALLLDRRRAAISARRAEELAAADRLKTGILSSLSHELRSPLGSLRAGLTTLGLPQAGLTPVQAGLVRDLDRQAARLDRLVGDLLTLSRVEAGIPGDRGPQDIAELVGGVVRRMEHQLAGISLEIDLPAGLPMIMADELQLERVVTNLLDNALQWTPRGGRIAVRARAGGDGLELAVENQGPPIRAANLDTVFDAFWTSRPGGLGLGLAMARRVAEAHGGTLSAENRRAGPRFVLRLPAPAPVTVP